MKISVLATIIHSFIRILILKLFHISTVKANYLQRISGKTSICLAKNGKLILGRNICIHKYGDLFIGKSAVLQIGNRVFFNNGVMVSCQKHVKIGDNSLIGPDVKIFDNDHRFDVENGARTDLVCGDIVIGSNCWIGANAIILRNTKIGDNCVIAAGTIVKGHIPDHSLVRQERKQIVTEIIKGKEKASI